MLRREKREKNSVDQMIQNYVFTGRYTITEILKNAEARDIPTFIYWVNYFKEHMDECGTSEAFRAQQLINLVENKNLEEEIRRAHGEHVVGDMG